MLKIFNKNKYTRGVTLIELLVVIAIIGIITVVTLADYGKYRSSMPTQNLADDIALSVRKAQGYAVGVRGDNSGFNYGYGIHFSQNSDISNPSNGSNKAFVLFKDISNTNTYDKNQSVTTCGTPTTTNECLEVLNITSNSKILFLKPFYKDNSTNVTGVGSYNVIFKRPEPEPDFCYINNGVTVCSDNIARLEIKVGDDTGVFKTVTIWKNGQISVD